ncbi:peptidase [Burkholderia sp. WAC0059]|uniref:D-alanyl-D-alanine carboxypeptidase family protein n=1 Tax=Burkholderia sp. WAC0059 TaxID=2066022 RepID=UPI000C7F7850|nr:D-alanyl-D-alanine carboxypeptidase family protein [Burkholderia sp. WAC0059]PLZ03469.1 peptidase [Burkholderia sp. WAC0059]
MRLFPSGLSISSAFRASFVPVSVRSVRRAFALGVLLPASLLAAGSAFAQVPPPAVTARSWVLVDATANQVLASGNPDERVEPASLTKLMTSYLVFEALQQHKISMDQMVTPSDAVRRVGNDESRMFIEAGKPVSVHDLVYGMIVQSGNDAAIALAELVGGSEANFVNMMNAEAQRLGMTHTHFADVNGMPDPQHYTTAGDLAKVSTQLIRDFPEYYSIFSVKEFTYDNIRQANRNRLLWLDPTVDGLKTGHTEAAGYCLIATANRPLPGASGGARRLVAVLMGEPSERARVQDGMKMLSYGYSAYETTRLYAANQAVATPRVYKGAEDTVRVGVKTDQYVTLPRGDADHAKPQIDLTSPLIAPLADGQQVGTARFVSADGKTLAQFPIVALQAVPQGGIASRVWDSLVLMINRKK